MTRLLAIFLIFALTPVSAYAVCSGGTLQQEFRQADVVVRARLRSEINAHDDAPSATFRRRWGNGSPVVLYGLNVVEVFKGRPGPRIAFFQERNSGAFYIDLDKDYLLIMSYIRPYPGRPTAARGALHIRYAGGQSRPWAEINRTTVNALRTWRRR